MAAKTDAYVDTSALIAFLDRSDSHHPRFRRLFADPPSLITTPLVVAEGHGWFLRRYDGTRALQFLGFIESLSPLQVMEISAADQAGAVDVLRRFADQALTMADAMGIHLMLERRTSVCWSTDRHLGLGGTPLVLDT